MTLPAETIHQLVCFSALEQASGTSGSIAID